MLSMNDINLSKEELKISAIYNLIQNKKAKQFLVWDLNELGYKVELCSRLLFPEVNSGQALGSLRCSVY